MTFINNSYLYMWKDNVFPASDRVSNGFYSPKTKIMNKHYLIGLLGLFMAVSGVNAQDQPLAPGQVGVGQYHGLSLPLRDWRLMR